MSFKVQKTDSFGVTYADPANPHVTVRVKNTNGNKSIDGHSVTNRVTEVIVNSTNFVSFGDETAGDAVSVRLRVSGAVQSATHVAELLAGLAALVPTWTTEDVFEGFPPSTAPSFTFS
jgi:hypothetical protein